MKRKLSLTPLGFLFGELMASLGSYALLTLLLISNASLAMAQGRPDGISELAKQGRSLNTVTPVYSQLVGFALPPGFMPAYAKDTGTHFIQEHVLLGPV